jgi:hypothetical protein
VRQPSELAGESSADLWADQSSRSDLRFGRRGDLHQEPAQTIDQPDTLSDDLVAIVVEDSDLDRLLV